MTKNKLAILIISSITYIIHITLVTSIYIRTLIATCFSNILLLVRSSLYSLNLIISILTLSLWLCHPAMPHVISFWINATNSLLHLLFSDTRQRILALFLTHNLPLSTRMFMAFRQRKVKEEQFHLHDCSFNLKLNSTRKYC